MGTYQPSTGQSECIQCPPYLTTKSVGSTDLSKCSGKFIMKTAWFGKCGAKVDAISIFVVEMNIVMNRQ